MEDKLSYEELEAKLNKVEAKYLESQDERWRQGKRIKELEAKLEDGDTKKQANEQELNNVKGIANDRKEALDKQSEHIEYIEGVLNEYVSAVENVNNGVAAALSNGRQLQKYTLAKIRGDN